MELSGDDVDVQGFNRVAMQAYRRFVDMLVNSSSVVDSAACKGIPHPFCAMVGTEYVASRCRVAFVGKETKGFKPDMPEFIREMRLGLLDHAMFSRPVQNLEYLKWMGCRKPENSFWWFVVSVLAELKCMTFDELCESKDPALKSFVWGNALAVESLKSKGVVQPDINVYENVVRCASKAEVNDFKFIDKYLRPDIVVITCARTIANKYLSEFELMDAMQKGRYAHTYFYLDGTRRVFVIETTHPARMARQRITADCVREVADKILKSGWRE